MRKDIVGSIKNINYDTDSDSLEVTIKITDNKFKKKLLRDLSLAGEIKFAGNKLIYQSNIDDEEGEKDA